MRELFRVLVLIAALCIVAIGLLLGILGIAFSLLGGGPDSLMSVTISTALMVLLVGLGSASAWHAWQAIQGRPSAKFGPKRVWPLVILFILALVLGQAVLSLSLLTVLTFPPLHTAASILPALILLVAVGRVLRNAATCRDMVLQVAAGALLAAPLAMALETVAILSIAISTISGLALQPGGQEQLVTITSYLQDPAWLQDPSALAPALLTPFVMAAALALVAGLIPLIEEAVKTIGVGLTAYRKPSLAQALLWGLAAGAGFSITEGLLNSAGGLGAWLPTVLLRLGTMLLHCLTGALMGLAWYNLFSARKWLRSVGLYLISVAIHGLWNGLATMATLLSLTTPDTGSASDTLLISGIGMLVVLLLLILLAFFMAGGLAGLTLYVNRRVLPQVLPGEPTLPASPSFQPSPETED